MTLGPPENPLKMHFPSATDGLAQRFPPLTTGVDIP